MLVIHYRNRTYMFSCLKNAFNGGTVPSESRGIKLAPKELHQNRIHLIVTNGGEIFSETNRELHLYSTKGEK